MYASISVIFSGRDVEDLCLRARIILGCGRVEVVCARDGIVFSGRGVYIYLFIPRKLYLYNILL